MWVLEVSGVGAERLTKLSGTHRVQRVPPNGGGRKHTSTATIAVLLSGEAAQLTLSEADLRVDRMRGRGRGGQRRNKVETAIRLTHIPSGLVVVRTSGRSQAANLTDARADLVRQLKAREEAGDAERVNVSRRKQVDSERSGKDFTHCWWRDEVVCHRTGQKWRIRDWKMGRIFS